SITKMSNFGIRISELRTHQLFKIRNSQSEFRNLFASSVLQNHSLRALVASRLVTARRYAPGRYRITTTGCFSFATTMRMVDRIHRHAAHVRANALPARATGLTERNIF